MSLGSRFGSDPDTDSDADSNTGRSEGSDTSTGDAAAGATPRVAAVDAAFRRRTQMLRRRQAVALADALGAIAALRRARQALAVEAPSGAPAGSALQPLGAEVGRRLAALIAAETRLARHDFVLQQRAALTIVLRLGTLLPRDDRHEALGILAQEPPPLPGEPGGLDLTSPQVLEVALRALEDELDHALDAAALAAGIAASEAEAEAEAARASTRCGARFPHTAARLEAALRAVAARPEPPGEAAWEAPRRLHRGDVETFSDALAAHLPLLALVQALPQIVASGSHCGMEVYDGSLGQGAQAPAFAAVRDRLEARRGRLGDAALGTVQAALLEHIERGDFDVAQPPEPELADVFLLLGAVAGAPLVTAQALADITKLAWQRATAAS